MLIKKPGLKEKFYGHSQNPTNEELEKLTKELKKDIPKGKVAKSKKKK